MALDTQTFGITRHWLSTSLIEIPQNPTIFTRSELSKARQLFLAGTNQLTSVKSWLASAEIINFKNQGHVSLSGLGKAVAAHDPQARKAWSWWLFHLHLATNREAFPYSTFFREFPAETHSWLTLDQIHHKVIESLEASGKAVSAVSVKKYFEGIDKAFRPGAPLYALNLVERRVNAEETSSKPHIRRTPTSPSDSVVAYATSLLQDREFSNQTTIETRQLLKAGLGRILGLPDTTVRTVLERLHADHHFARVIQYKKVVNLDSVQFLRKGMSVLEDICVHGYEQEGARWT